MIQILIQVGSLVLVEARGKGGASTGGGNSWRGGNTGEESEVYSSLHSVLFQPPSSSTVQMIRERQPAGKVGKSCFILKFISVSNNNQEMEQPCGPGSS